MSLWYDAGVGAAIPDGWERSSCRRLECEDGLEGLARMEDRFGEGTVRWLPQHGEIRWSFLVRTDAIRAYRERLGAIEDAERAAADGVQR